MTRWGAGGGGASAETNERTILIAALKPSTRRDARAMKIQ